MFEVSVTGGFTAAHQLRLADGTFEPLNEHHWRVVVSYAGPQLDATGVLLDFTRLRDQLAGVLAPLDGRRLNDLPEFTARSPSAENVAAYVAAQLPQEIPGAARLTCVEVEEEPGCIARFRPPVPASPPCG